MSENDSLIERVILIDEPSKEDLFHGKGHEKTASSLAKAIRDFKDKDRSIGLDGPWGSGKSSIVEMAEKELNESKMKGSINYCFFTFDIWKSQGSAFRRSFLEHLLSWSINKFPSKERKLKEIEKNVKGKTRIIDTNNRTVLDLYGVIILLLVPFLPLYYFWAKSVFDKLDKKIDFLLSTPFSVLLGFLALTLFRAFISWSKEKPNMSFLEAISKTLLISAKKYEDHTVKQQIREIDPNDFEFEFTLRNILEVVQNDSYKIVFVLDNIDRLPPDEIDEYWALVRSVFSRNSYKNENNGRTLTAIVPYDRHHILNATEINEEENKQNKQNISSLSDQEIFSKTFDDVLSVSPPVMSNSKEFFEEKITAALPKFKNKEELFRVYLIFNTILQSDNGHATPRQIIFFINELTGLYTLHSGRFELTTIAIYFAYKDFIENNPAVLTSPEFISERLRNLSSDSEIEKKLAAIAYNVDEDLAFQVLLDQKIVAAAQADNFETLEILSKSPGFDIRVNEVIQDTLPEWVRSKGIGQVIVNFTKLSKTYKGSSIRYVHKSLIDSLSEIKSIELNENEYKKYFGLLEFGDIENLGDISEKLIILVHKSIGNDDGNQYKLGELWGNFVNDIKNELIKFNGENHIKTSLKKLKIPSNFDFMFGLGFKSEEHQIPLSLYEDLKISDNKDHTDPDESTIRSFILDSPEVSKHAFRQFNQIDVFRSDEWVDFANLLIVELCNEECSADNFPDLIEILSDIWNYIPNSRESIDLRSLYSQTNFYEGLHEIDSKETISFAVFLALQLYPDCEIPIPKKRNPSNGAWINNETDGFIWFRDLIKGEGSLNDEQIKIVSNKTVSALSVSELIRSGNDIENSLIDNIIVSAFLSENVPRIALSTLLNDYSYLSSLFENNLSNILSKYGKLITDKDLISTKIQDYSIDFIKDTFNLDEWSECHDDIENKLNSISADEWHEHIISNDHEFKILLEKSKLSNFIVINVEFREMLEEFLINTFNGKIEIESPAISYDKLINTIDSKYHSDLFRKIREGFSSVTSSSLSLCSTIFPSLMSSLINIPNDADIKEKDNIIRHLLCLSLESNNRETLKLFLSSGKQKVSNYIKASQESTKEKVSASLKAFGEINEDRKFGRSIAELLESKKQANTWFDIWFPSKNEEETEGENIEK